MFQKNAFQANAFQYGNPTVVTTPDSGGLSTYSYHPEYQQAVQQQKIKREKTELQKLESVLSEYQRRESLAAESLRIAEESERNRLIEIQNNLISEINRLLMVKAEMMARVKRSEEELLLMVALRRKRLRAI